MTVKKQSPVSIDVEEGQTYFLCSCGHSENYPFCDGAHRVMCEGKKSVPYTATETKTIICENGVVKD